MGLRTLLTRFTEWQGRGEALVLATVTETAGSTYSKAGHRMLIAGTSEWQGLISGGCLEGDLAAHAEAVRNGAPARLVSYDLRAGGEDVFGLGVGCDGLIRVLLQRLDPARDYAPWPALAHHLAEGPAARYLLVTTATNDLPAGAMLAVAPGQPAMTHDLDEAAATALSPLLGTPGPMALPPPWSGGQALVGELTPRPRLLVLGAGADVPPLVTMAQLVDFHVCVYDHRPAALARVGAADVGMSGPAAALAGTVDLSHVDAAVVMSHHLESDRSYLAQLAASPVPHIALLGPRGRRDRLLRELGSTTAARLAGRLRAPAGLDLGASDAEGIALAIVAELCALRRGRTARPLGEAAG